MLTWLSGWLRDIIVIILLATFVDLMLPNRALTRYVKLVVSLFILLAILTPLVHLLKSDWNSAKMTAAIEELPEAVGAGRGLAVGSQPQLQEILAQGLKLKDEQLTQTVPEVESRIAQMIADDLHTADGDMLRNVKVTTQQLDNGELGIKQVELHLSSQPKVPDGEGHGAREPSIEEIQPVMPVNVNIELENNRETSFEGTVHNRSQQPPGPPQPTEQERAEAKAESAKVRYGEQLRNKWGIHEQQITVIYSDGSRNGE
ncbi:stage III sporulation protein AF [Paenibacillus swuensis]|uniref:stage III sporulation protein AF n=1 Tax=Paenibacillus swuensis TaxID=1178515 RepID=UPI00083963CE|nr:stage III sporulation protein AF [Paenibacillus swuensis]